MNFIILAAGFGTRLRPLTSTTPKPLIKVHDKALIAHLLDKILPCSKHIFVNVSWLGELIEHFIANSYPNSKITCINEGNRPLETGGGIVNILQHMKRHPTFQDSIDEPFAVVNADIYTDFNFVNLNVQKISGNTLAHLVLVDCPEDRTHGDFSLLDHQVQGSPAEKGDLVFSGISVLHPDLLYRCGNSASDREVNKKAFSLTSVLYEACQENRVSGEHYAGEWCDVGTINRLQFLNQQKRLG